MKKMNVGIIGAGRIGRVHAESISYHIPNATIKAVSDVRLDGVKEWAKGLGIEDVYSDYHKILEDKEIDAVLVCSSTDTHAQISIEAAEAGKHIFCEKPIDYDLDRINHVLEVVEKAGVKFQVGFNRRFDHNFDRINKVTKDGVIGEPHIIKITSRDPEPPPIAYVKVSGGIFFDMAIHDFDMARFQAGCEATEVYAIGDSLVDPEIGKAGDVDTAITTIKFENGAMAVIDNSRRAAYGYDQRVEVFGSKGSIEARNDTETNTIIRTADNVASDKPLYFFLERYMGSFVEEMKQFFAAIENDTEPPVKGIDGLNSVIIAMAAKKSLDEGRPVKISEIYAV
ncbi:inositol 2-dehydrogenase [Vallitalea pronyensis]|uniref:Inositol 2-dehydrogenase n=1 Tax=Vallitalea pronyensis TaxID=1348613 RepID=A0A8J8MM41_9FIRM|nr:inositol 2-dehydrogenase [Vallitalea pronyensis]QUI24021.1 inositol 2-dehydrogenase [Vallitalea pronyensis]